MSKHWHFTQTKRVKDGEVVINTVVRDKYADAEQKIMVELGYSTKARYCTDPLCLGDEPMNRASA